MARAHTGRNFAKESDPAFNRQFRRLWTEPPLRKGQHANAAGAARRQESRKDKMKVKELD